MSYLRSNKYEVLIAGARATCFALLACFALFVIYLLFAYVTLFVFYLFLLFFCINSWRLGGLFVRCSWFILFCCIFTLFCIFWPSVLLLYFAFLSLVQDLLGHQFCARPSRAPLLCKTSSLYRVDRAEDMEAQNSR